MKQLVTLAALRRARSRRVQLVLRRSGLEAFSAPPAELARVVELDLAYNAFRDWPLATVPPPALETLNLAQNEISLIEAPGVGMLPALSSLTLDYNPLSGGLGGLLGMRGLRSISLQSCGLSDLPEAVCQLADLRTLELGNNQLQVLPQALEQLVHLERIGLRGNPLRSLEVLGSLPRLEQVEVDFMAEPEALTFLQQLSERGVKVDIRGASYHAGTATPLQVAAMRGDVASVTLQATSETITSTLGHPQYSLLDIACSRADLALARWLCEAGLSSRRTLSSRYPSTPLHQACSFALAFCRDPTVWVPRVQLIHYLVQQGADVEARDFAGLTPLHRACTMGIYSAWGRSDLVRALVDAGADVNAKSARGEPAIEIAVRLGDYRTATTLMSLGADIRSATPGLAHVAASQGHARLCEALLEGGAPALDARSATIIHAATLPAAPNHRVDSRRRADLIERAARAQVPLDHKDGQGKSALHEACAARDPKLVEQLIRLKARLDLRDQSGATPLHVAVRSAVSFATSALDIVTKLLEAGADPDVRDGSGDTPLHLAARAKHAHATRLLLRFAANLGIGNEAGETPETLLATMELKRDALPALHCAACHGRRAGIEALIHSERVNVNALDERGRTALFYAHQVKTAQLLLRLGASPTLADATGHTAESVLREKKKLAAADTIRAARGASLALQP